MNDTDIKIIAIAITGVFAIAGWTFAFWQSKVNKRRDIRLEFLIESYRQLEAVSNRHNKDTDHERMLESAVANIRLLGSPEQIQLVDKFIDQHCSHSNGDLTALLKNLFTELRRELNLDYEHIQFRCFRME